MIEEFNKILAESCDAENFNRINVIDLSQLKGNLRKHIRNLAQSTIFAQTKRATT